MCMNCGCGKPDDRHGHPENVTAGAEGTRRGGRGTPESES